MATSNTNPFILPGLGQSGETAQNPLLASMEMMRTAWEGLARAGGFEQALATSGVSSQDLERRIADLRAVEHWLQMNLSMLSSTIQALEVQRATMSTLTAFMTSATQGGAAQAWAPMAEALRSGASSAPSGDSTGLFGMPVSAAQPPGQPAGFSSPATATDNAGQQPAVQAAQAWWNTLQNQFENLAQATQATMKSAESIQQAMESAQQQAMDSVQAQAAKAAQAAQGAHAAQASPAGGDAQPQKASAPAAKKAASRKTASKQAASKQAAAKKSASKKTATSRRGTNS